MCILVSPSVVGVAERRGRRVRRDGPAARIGMISECVPSGSRVNYKAKELSSDKDRDPDAARRGARDTRKMPAATRTSKRQGDVAG